MKNNLKKLLNNDRWTHWGYCKNFPRLSISLATVALFVLTSTARPSHANDHHDHGYNFRIVAKLGDPAPGGGTHEGDFEPQAINENGDVSFASDLSQEGEGLFLSRHGVNTEIIRTGLPAPGTSTTFGPGGILGESGINNSGDMAFAFMLDYPSPFPLPRGKIAGVWRYDASHSAVTKLLGQGGPAPGGTTFQGTSSSPDINNSGVVATTGLINTDKGNCRVSECLSPPHTLGLGRGIYAADRRNRISKIIAPGDPAPGTGSTIDDAVEPNINDSGDMVFSAHVVGETCGYDSGPSPTAMGCFTSLYLYRSSTGQISSIAHQGNPAPGGGNFRFVVMGQINNRRDMAYIGDLATGPNYNIQIPGVFFTDRRGVSRAVARPGDRLPGGVMVQTTTAEGNLGLNNSGVVAFVAQLDADVNSDTYQDTGVYVDHGGIITTVVRTGTVIPGLGTVAHTNNSYVVGFDLSPGVHINDQGDVFTQVILENGDTYAVVASPQ